MRWHSPLLAVLTSLLFFGGVEGVLWTAGVEPLTAGRDPFEGFSEHVKVFRLDARGEAYETAPSALPTFNLQRFQARKPAGGLRVFALGGSSAYGFPWGANLAFPHLFALGLRAVYPERSIEVVNAAGMSYASHRLRILTHEILGYEPDVLVIYGGHNEFIERRFYQTHLERPKELDALRGVLHRTRTYSALTRLWRPDAARPGADDGTFELAVAREQPLGVSDAVKEEVRTRFEANLRAIVTAAREAGVRVVLCTVPSNVSGWAPEESFFSPETPLAEQRSVLGLLDQARAHLEGGGAEAALAALDRAQLLAAGYAGIHFERGRALDALGRPEEARVAFVRARDADGSPSRAPSAFNQTVRRVAGESGARLVDVEDLFRSLAPRGLLGFEIFEDYVHPKPHAHQWIARALWNLFLEEGLAGAPRLANAKLFRTALRGAPQRPLEPANRAAQLFNLGVVLVNQGRENEAQEKFRAALEFSPDYVGAHLNLGILLSKKGQYAEAVTQLREAQGLRPDHLRTAFALGESLRRLGQLAEAAAALERAVAAVPDSAEAWKRIGRLYYEQERATDAERAYRRALELAPSDADLRSLHGLSLAALGRYDEASANYERVLMAQPEHRGARNGLAGLHAAQGRHAEAARQYRAVLAVDPENDVARAGLAALE